MTIRNWLWLSFRIAWIIVGLIQGPHFVAELGAERAQQPSWIFAIKMIGIISIAIVVLIGIQAGRGATTEKWPRPSWFENPFGLDRPVSTFEAGAYYVFAAGVSAAYVELHSTPRTWDWEILISAGAGLWLGAQVCLIAYRRCFVTSRRPG
jgi:hypothetical protein